MVTTKEAASYCGIPVTRFPAECEVRPVEMPHGKKLYDIHDLDAWLDSLKPQSLDDDLSILERLGT